jgi:hypothetical protein
MSKKARTTKKSTAALPVGIKASRRPISSAKMRMIMNDRGIASGGRNIVHRQRSTAA